MGGRVILGGRGRNLWRTQWEAVLFSAAEGATHGATNGRNPLPRSIAAPLGLRCPLLLLLLVCTCVLCLRVSAWYYE